VVSLQVIHWVNTGNITVDRIISNEEALKSAIDGLESDANDLVVFVNAYMGFGSLSIPINTIGETIIVDGGSHPDMRLRDVYVSVGSESSEPCVIDVVSGTQGLCDMFRFDGGESLGSIKINTPYEFVNVLRSDSVSVISDSSQTMIVNLNFKPMVVV